MTTTERSRNIRLDENDNRQNYGLVADMEDCDNEIPYHAREHARPFTYGNLPLGFKKSDLNHVSIEDLPESPKMRRAMLPPSPSMSRSEFNHGSIEELPESPKYVRTAAVLPPSPSMMRRTARPSISPSRPVLRKTPSRQEFEEMLRERREQSMREQNHAVQEAQNAVIQKDLDALQEKLNKNALLLLKDSPAVHGNKENTCREMVKHVETIDLPDETTVADKHDISSAIVESPTKYQPALIIVEANRPETPTFPVPTKSSLEDRCVSPYPLVDPGSPSLQRAHSVTFKIQKDRRSPLKLPALPSHSQQSPVEEKQSPEIPQDVAPHLVKFARDSSEYWYKPHMTREEAIALLRRAPPGTFIIRNSTTYKNAFGLVLRVAKPPQGISMPETGTNSDVLVRHFLLEPTTRGVRLKGCTNEPTFTSLSALVYQHSVNQLALPCKLIIATRDLLLSPEDAELMQTQRQLLEQGAACNVLYLFSLNMESLTGDEAIRKAVYEMYAQSPLPAPIEVHLKVSQSGITLTDNKRRLFFRRHYTSNNVSHIGMDPENRFYSVLAFDEGLERTVNKTIFAFVARPATGSRDNQCHVFCDLAATQPASAIVSFAQKVLHLNKSTNHQIL